MADIYIVRQRIKGALQFTGAALLVAGFATWSFHHQLEFDEDRNRFVMSALITGALGIAWIGLLIFYISAIRMVNTSNNFSNRFDNLPWWFLRITALLLIIGGVTLFIVRTSDQAETEFDLMRRGKLAALEARLQENPARSLRGEKKGGMTLVQAAFQENYPEALGLMLKYGAPAEELEEFDGDPVFLSFGNPDMLAVLFSSGFDPDRVDADGVPLIHYAVAQNNAEILDLLLINGAKVNARDSLFRTPLMRAVEEGNVAMTELLLSNGADVNAFDKRGDTALHRAVRRKNLKLTAFLLEQRADPAIFNFIHMTALHLAALDGQDELVQLFTGQPELVDLWEDDGRAPLDYALKSHKYDTAMLLIEAGADVNRSLESGETLLHELILARDYQSARFLIRAGADARIPDSKGETAYDIMQRKELSGLLELVDGPSADPIPSEDPSLSE